MLKQWPLALLFKQSQAEILRLGMMMESSRNKEAYVNEGTPSAHVSEGIPSELQSSMNKEAYVNEGIPSAHVSEAIPSELQSSKMTLLKQLGEPP